MKPLNRESIGFLYWIRDVFRFKSPSPEKSFGVNDEMHKYYIQNLMRKASKCVPLHTQNIRRWKEMQN